MTTTIEATDARLKRIDEGIEAGRRERLKLLQPLAVARQALTAERERKAALERKDSRTLSRDEMRDLLAADEAIATKERAVAACETEVEQHEERQRYLIDQQNAINHERAEQSWMELSPNLLGAMRAWAATIAQMEAAREQYNGLIAQAEQRSVALTGEWLGASRTPPIVTSVRFVFERGRGGRRA
jgi:hypothetical protein